MYDEGLGGKEAGTESSGCMGNQMKSETSVFNVKSKDTKVYFTKNHMVISPSWSSGLE